MMIMRTVSVLFFSVTLAVGWSIGWLSKGWFDSHQAIIATDIVSNIATEASETDDARRVLPSNADQAEGAAVEAQTLPVAEEPAVISAELMASFEQLLFQHRMAEFSQYLRENLQRFTSADIEALGAIFVAYALEIGLDHYQSSFELMNIEARIASLDTYSPSAQFFDVIEQAGTDPLTALRLFDELASYFQEQVTDAQLQRLENWLVRHVEQKLIEDRNASALENWYLALIARTQDPSHLYRRLARLYFELGRHMESLDVQDKLSGYSGWNLQDEELYQANSKEVADESVESIALQKTGEHYIATVRLNNRVDAALLLDTGASISGLDQQFIQSQGFEISGRKIRLNTAGGRVDSDLIRLSSVQLGNNQIHNLDVASLRLGGNAATSRHPSRYQGLLGMDVLGQFEFYLDQRKAILYLRPQSSNTENGQVELPPEFY